MAQGQYVLLYPRALYVIILCGSGVVGELGWNCGGVMVKLWWWSSVVVVVCVVVVCAVVVCAVVVLW